MDSMATSEAAKIASTPEREKFLGAFYGRYSATFNLLSLVLQAFAVSRLFRFLGVGGTMFVLPLISLTGYSTLLVVPVLAVAQWTKIFENAADYSIQNTIKQTLFLLTSREAKYRAKAVIDTFFHRSGDVFAAGVVALAVQTGMGTRGFSALTVGIASIWVFVVVRLFREYQVKKSTPQAG
jgi:ATP:ADP antiporter, AAA family